jgi:hypothetical protein
VVNLSACALAAAPTPVTVSGTANAASKQLAATAQKIFSDID